MEAKSSKYKTSKKSKNSFNNINTNEEQDDDSEAESVDETPTNSKTNKRGDKINRIFINEYNGCPNAEIEIAGGIVTHILDTGTRLNIMNRKSFSCLHLWPAIYHPLR